MSFIFDTGSAWTWVPSQDCPDDQCPNEHYQYTKSNGYRNTGTKDAVYYGIGSVEGYVVNDDVAIANSQSAMALDVNFLSVFGATDLSGIKSDGLLGLSPRNKGTAAYNGVHLLVD